MHGGVVYVKLKGKGGGGEGRWIERCGLCVLGGHHGRAYPLTFFPPTPQEKGRRGKGRRGGV